MALSDILLLLTITVACGLIIVGITAVICMNWVESLLNYEEE